MVEDRVTGATRIAQLLASELTGLEAGALADVTLVDVDRDATPSEGGTEAYRVAYRGTPVAGVRLYPGAVEVSLRGDRTWPESEHTTSGADDIRREGDRLRVTSGAAVKRAVDALGEVLGPPDPE